MNDFLKRLKQAQMGDLSSLEHLVHEFGWVVDQECRRVLLGATADLSVSDLRQETWLKICRKLDRFDPFDLGFARPQFANWLRTLSRRVALELIQKRDAKCRKPDEKVVSLGVLDPKGNVKTASSILKEGEQLAELHNAINSLSSVDLRQVITLCFFDELSLKQIAERLELSYDQVRYRFHSAIRELEESINL